MGYEVYPGGVNSWMMSGTLRLMQHRGVSRKCIRGWKNERG